MRAAARSTRGPRPRNATGSPAGRQRGSRLPGRGPAALAARFPLRFTLAEDAVSTVIPGARNVRQVEMNASADEVRIPQEVVDKLRARLGNYNFYHRHGIRI